MPLAKSAEVVVEQPITEHKQSPLVSIDGSMPYEVYAYLGVSPFSTSPTDKDRLRDIYDFAKGETLGETLNKIASIESKLGMGGTDKRTDKLWNWIRMTKHIQRVEEKKKALQRERSEMLKQRLQEVEEHKKAWENKNLSGVTNQIKELKSQRKAWEVR